MKKFIHTCTNYHNKGTWSDLHTFCSTKETHNQEVEEKCVLSSIKSSYIQILWNRCWTKVDTFPFSMTSFRCSPAATHQNHLNGFPTQHSNTLRRSFNYLILVCREDLRSLWWWPLMNEIDWSRITWQDTNPIHWSIFGYRQFIYRNHIICLRNTTYRCLHVTIFIVV